MNRPGILPLAAALLLTPTACGSAQTSSAAPLVLERTIPLPHVSGRIDHLAYDPDGRRLYVAELGNGSIDAVDVASGGTARIDGLNEPQGIAFLPAQAELVVACGGDGSVRFYDARTLRPVAIVQLGDDADNVGIDPVTRLVAVGYGSGGLALIDATRHAIVRRIALPGHPEGFEIEPTGRRAFVNIPSRHAIAVVDLATGETILRPAAHGQNFPMALRGDAGLLATGYRAPARVVLTDAATGAVRQDLNGCGDVDDLFFDLRRGRLYLACGSGSVDVFARNGDAYSSAGRIETRQGARTAIFIPQLDRLFVAAPARTLGEAALLVYRGAP
ncbi:MAG: hypothetical protein JWO81_2041 [Alphaproteobacteria bacterium]|nr:hypothetical protein [Alphaproteobacteria bacterium]